MEAHRAVRRAALDGVLQVHDGVVQQVQAGGAHAQPELDGSEVGDAAGAADQLTAWLAVATRSFDRFIAAAQRLRADYWMPVDAMGEAAAKAGKRDLAAEVYGAAIAGGGWHVGQLTRLCRQRTRGPSPSSTSTPPSRRVSHRLTFSMI